MACLPDAIRAPFRGALLLQLGGTILLSLLSVASPAAALSDLQSLIDATPEGGVLRLSPGSYQGRVVIRKPMVVEGGGDVTIDAGGKGTVIKIEADGVTVRGLRLVGSGENHDRLDAGVQIRGDGNVIADNVIEDCLFGVDVQQANGNTIEGNRISSKPLDLGLRGDSVRLWYARENRIVGNEITGVRDMVVWYSADNVIARNRATGGRYALHFMYSRENLVEENVYVDNIVGVFLMYSDGVVLRRNRIMKALGPTGMGVGFKESSNVVLEENSIIYCSTGIYLDVSPYQPDTVNRFSRNRFSYNGVAILFHNDWSGNSFRDNDFRGNFTQVAVRGGGGANRNEWVGNHWDDYRGFDRDGDDRGDTPYEVYSYADEIWMDIPSTAFFRGSPLFEAIHFLDRLAPFSEPTLVLRDEVPRFSYVGEEQ